MRVTNSPKKIRLRFGRGGFCMGFKGSTPKYAGPRTGVFRFKLDRARWGSAAGGGAAVGDQSGAGDKGGGLGGQIEHGGGDLLGLGHPVEGNFV